MSLEQSQEVKHTMNPSPQARGGLRLASFLYVRRGEPPLARRYPQWTCPRGGMRLRLAPALALMILMSGLMNNTPPAAAQPAAHDATEALSEAQLEGRRQKIRQFVQDRLQRRAIVATTVTPSGQVIDWIRPESQTADGILAQPPGPPTAQPGTTLPPPGSHPEALAQGERQAQTEVQRDASLRGPEGTVPVVRFDVEKYLASVRVPPENPQDMLRKMPPPEPRQAVRRTMPAPAPASNNRYYVVWRREGTFFGSAGRINIWNTAGPYFNETSIAQVAVIGGTPLQTVEAGKIELYSLNGDQRPHLFTWYTTNGHASQGDYVGGYNTLVIGWIQSSPTVAPGMSLVGWESQTGGPQRDVDVEVRLYQGNWWIKAAGQWAGYYPGWLFSASGIRNSASRLDWYGEVFDSFAPAATVTDMGSGKFASAGWQHAAYFRNLIYFPSPLFTDPVRLWDSGTLSVTDAGCYSGSGPFYNSDPSWRNWFFYGGPGSTAEAPGCQ
jgi:Neprosin